MAKCENCNNLYNLSDENDLIVGKWCPKISDSPDIETEIECKHFKAMSQADRIRAMSDKELAEFLVDVETHGYYDQSVSGTLEMINWLQSEVEG